MPARGGFWDSGAKTGHPGRPPAPSPLAGEAPVLPAENSNGRPCVGLCLSQTLQFKKVSLLGWSDGGITALVAAARYPSYIRKMVIWGANAYVTDEDARIYEGRSGPLAVTLAAPALPLGSRVCTPHALSGRKMRSQQSSTAEPT